ncbi:MAG: acyltransferase [Bacteroidales bacterium]|nr:acyltransferase [Bacteroidales bacterium]
MVFKGYTKRDTSIIKGFGILCIVLHNYFHWLTPSPGENEFEFSPDRVFNFFHQLVEKPGEFVNILFSYLGHYGVQLFIFISGFGLAYSMMKHRRTWESFMVTRLKKLYPLLLIGVVFFIFSKVLIEGKMISDYDMTEIEKKLLLIHTLISNSGTSINGPWWFFALIFQLYLLFPFLFKATEKWGWKTFAIASLLSYLFVFLFRYVLAPQVDYMVMMNAPGHLPEFCLGILLAFCKDKKINLLWLPLAIAIFCLGNFYVEFYPFTFLSLTLIMVFAYQGLKTMPVRKKELAVFFEYFGGISMALFATHAVLRGPVLEVANTYTSALGHLWSGVMFLLIAWGVAFSAKALYDFIETTLDKIHILENSVTHVMGIVFKVLFVVFFSYVMGFYVAQNFNKFDQTLELKEIAGVSAVIKNSDKYLPLATAISDENMLALDINGSFDITSSDTDALLPNLVVEIQGVLWDMVVIPNRFNSTTENRFTFSYKYLRPFNKSLKNKQIKVYLWNNGQASLKIDNADVSIVY